MSLRATGSTSHGGNVRRTRGMLMLVVAPWCAASAAVAQEKPDTRLSEAQMALDEANTLWDAGRYDESIARGEQSLALREAVLGSAHPDVATSLDMLGSHLLLRGDAVRAETHLQRALAIREAALDANPAELARTLDTLGRLYAEQAMYGRAEPLYARALAIREAALGKDHPRVAETLDNLGNLYTAQRLYVRAEPLYLRALAIQEAALGKDHP